jgi:PQQ-dependent dehydrogenase (methanol/ethanol family)
VLSLLVVEMTAAQEGRFKQLCASCHGDGGTGGDRAPSLVDSRSLRARSETQIGDLIRNGTRGGMPAFRLPDEQLRELAHWVHSLNASAYEAKPAGDIPAGRQYFFGEGKCGTCHMVRGQGKTNGPDLSLVGRQLTVHEIEQTLIDPTAQMGTRSAANCPGWAFCAQEPWAVVNVGLQNGTALSGFARSEGKHDIQLQTFDGRFHSLTDAEYKQIKREKNSYMPQMRASDEDRRNVIAYLSSLGQIKIGPIEVADAPNAEDTKENLGEWTTYNGDPGGNRHSKLREIDADNVNRLQLKWSYSLPNSGLQTTPLMKDGLMFVTGPDQVCMLDAKTGREIWCYKHELSKVKSNSQETFRQPNRGVALLGDRVFFASSDAHLICLNRVTGGVMWDVKLPETEGRYAATSAPLIVDNLVICGIAGGDTPLRGFLAAYRPTTGEQVWRFWTVPKRGEPGSETWDGKALETGGAATWLTGSYDAEGDTLFWTTGNPFPATDGNERGGTNLYTNCVLALEPKTGKLKWHFQFTPHDLHDWDATEPLLLVDTQFQGHLRKLILQANRSGFFYVLDRTNGEFLLARPFVRKLNWASGIDRDGKPQLLEANLPTKGGNKGCPAVRGATNWYSTAFNPETKLFYVMAVEDCSLYRQSQRGGYGGYRDPQSPGEKYLRAIDIESGKTVWEIKQVGVPEANYSGVLSTASGLVFYGETGGSFAAVRAQTGECLWHFDTGVQWKASPMTYSLDGKQYVAVAAGSNILAFGLSD